MAGSLPLSLLAPHLLSQFFAQIWKFCYLCLRIAPSHDYFTPKGALFPLAHTSTIMIHHFASRCAALCSAAIILSATASAAPVVTISTSDGHPTIAVDGNPVYIKGVGGTNHLSDAREMGANAFRNWDGTVESLTADLQLADSLGMYVMQGIWLSKNPDDYRDPRYRQALRDKVTALATAARDSHSLVAWGIGNEIELDGNNNDAVCWGFVDELSRLIKSIDPSHLTSTVISHCPSALDSIARYAPSLDFVGINSYGHIYEVADMVTASDFAGPYIITEWGPTGWWQSELTEWGAPLEQTSEQKRQVYESRYNACIYGAPRCMGSFVFLWGQKEERTPTWFSMFVEDSCPGLPLRGEATPMVEAMNRVWTRTEPAATAPVATVIAINGVAPSLSPTVSAGESFEAVVMATDREQQQLTYVWEILHEATVTATGGAYEPRPDRVGTVVTTTTPTLSIAVPAPGNYRLYCYILDGTGYAATLNSPFQAR